MNCVWGSLETGLLSTKSVVATFPRVAITLELVRARLDLDLPTTQSDHLPQKDSTDDHGGLGVADPIHLAAWKRSDPKR
jgi:hypothetical protein